VIGALGSDEFARLRVGIGEDSMPDDRAGFVLEDFPGERRKDVEELAGRSADAVRAMVRDGPAKAMAAYNG
jgi:PTH1 family peptidyl-tRNA hydrolase